MPQNCAVGIDVSKNSLDVYIKYNNKSKHKKFDNNPSGISEIKKYILNTKIQEQFQVILESTGDYHMYCAYVLGKIFDVQVINPLISRKYFQIDIRKVKNDKVDSQKLAELGLNQKFSSNKITKEQIKKRKLIVLIDTLEKHISSLKLAFNNTKDTLKSFDINLESLEQFETQIKLLDKQMLKANEELRKLVVKDKFVTQLADTQGISTQIATKIVALIEDRDFHSKGALIAYTGLDVSTKESGLWKGKSRITKRGNSQLRKYLIQASWGLLMHNQYMQKYVRRHKERGRKYMEILVIIARKLTCMIYGSWKNDTSFDISMLS